MGGGVRGRVLAVVVALLLAGCGSAVPTPPVASAPATAPAPATTKPPATSPPSQSVPPASTPSATPAVAHYAEPGLSFDYPSGWRFSPVVSRFSFQGTSGYVGTISVTQEQICQKTALSAKCDYRAYDLPPGNVMVLLSHVGNGPPDPVAIFDHPAKGSRVTVGDMPAVFSQRTLAADRVALSWMIARPDAAGNWIQFDADMRGPDDGSLRAGVEAMIASFRFDPPPTPLPTSQPAIDAIVAKEVAARMAAAPDDYACFPDRTGVVRHMTVKRLPSIGLLKGLPVTCSVTIEATDVHLWRLELVATWKAAADRPAGTYRTVEWLLADGSWGSGSGAGDQVPYCCR